MCIATRLQRFLVLILSLLTATFCLAAAPAPQPASFALKQTSKEEILARQRAPLQKRASGVPFQTCYNAPDYNAAVYSEKTSGAIDQIGSSTTTVLEECVEACRDLDGCRGALFGDEGTGDFYCNLYRYVNVGQFDAVNARIIFLDTTCADNAINVADSTVPCCDI